VPSAALMRATLDAIYDAIDAGETLYLHCWGGVGRTGTVVGGRGPPPGSFTLDSLPRRLWYDETSYHGDGQWVA